MRYLADLLTLSRFILAIILLILAFIGSPAENAFIIFLVAEFTDTFDGTCARKWPFPKNKTPKYRKYAAQFDIVSDVLLAAAQVLFCTLQVNWIVGLIVIIYYTLICGSLELILYGKFFGHPDNCTKNSLTKRNFPLAKKIVLTRRYLYTICLGIVNAFILFATSWPAPVKYGLFIFGCSIFIFIWFFLRQRRKHISRDAVDIENILSKQKSHKA
ncbi:CDP-alcohol phosphatidyltransferase family protein [Candidatus Saccharibacteria bacterium]|nr:CDP-alcohol phosphatidyltransferase family protein [Candidatus Saccharibacteria bacterium]